MRAEVLWGEMPKEYRAAFEPLLLKHGNKLPLWCAHVSVRFRPAPPDQAGTVAFVEADPEYRQLKVCITPDFLGDTPTNRERTVIHEFLHVPVAPIRSWITKILEHYVDDEPLRKLLFNQYHDLEEGCVQDLTFSFSPPKPPRA